MTLSYPFSFGYNKIFSNGSKMFVPPISAFNSKALFFASFKYEELAGTLSSKINSKLSPKLIILKKASDGKWSSNSLKTYLVIRILLPYIEEDLSTKNKNSTLAPSMSLPFSYFYWNSGKNVT